MTTFTQEDIQGIADLIDQRVMAGQEAVRQEFYGAIQQLINNQQALAEMLASRNGSGEVVTALAHEFWQRSVMLEAQRVQAELNDVWEGLKPQEETEPESELPIDIPPQPRPTQCPDCQSRDVNAIYRLQDDQFCHNRWHDA